MNFNNKFILKRLYYFPSFIKIYYSWNLSMLFFNKADMVVSFFLPSFYFRKISEKNLNFLFVQYIIIKIL